MARVVRKGPAPGCGPFRVSVWSPLLILAALWMGSTSCAGSEPRGGVATPVVMPRPDTTVISGPDDEVLVVAEAAWLAGDFETAIAVSDSLDAAWSRQPGVSAALVRRLVRLLLVQAADDRAVQQLLYHPQSLDGEWRSILRTLVGGLSLSELDSQVRRVTADAKALGTVQVELVRALALSGNEARATELAAEWADEDLDRRDRDILEDFAAGRIPAVIPGIRVGVVVPLTGGFAPVGEEVLQGVQLAAERYERDVGISVELITVDEALESDNTGFGIPWLEAQGVVAVIGPIRSAALRAAAAARSSPGTLIISPTATEDTGLGPHAYSIWARERRDRAVAAALGNWLASSIELTRVAAFHPANESGYRRSDIFRSFVEAAGFEWVGSRAYQPDSTTFETELAQLTELNPDAILIIADGPRQVLQIAPQVHFFGLRGRIALVSEDWTHPTVLRRLDPTFSDFRVTATYFERTGNPEWDNFVADWDRAYRRSVPDNAFAALGYDAGLLLLRAIPDPTLVRPGSVARSVTRLRDVQTATGRFSFDHDARRIVRRTRIRMLLDSRLVDPDPEAIVEWSLEVRAQEEERVRLEAEKELLRRGEAP